MRYQWVGTTVAEAGMAAARKRKRAERRTLAGCMGIEVAGEMGEGK
jgi:hypothetical protein